MGGNKCSPITSIVISALDHIKGLEVYQKCWISDHFMFNIMAFQVPSIVDLGVDTNKMNLVIGRKFGSLMDEYNITNTCGVFRYRAYIDCPYEKKERRVTYYYFIEIGVPDMPVTSNFPELSSDDILRDKVRSNTRESAKKRDSESALDGQLVVDIANIEDDIISSSNKRPKLDIEVIDIENINTFNDRNKILVDYWQSPECYKLFGVNNEDNVKLVLQHRIKLLSAVARSPLGYKHVISGFDESNESSDYDIWVIQQKSSILCLAYHYALENMNNGHG